MDRPAPFWRRYAAYSLDVLAPLAASVPLLWNTGRRLVAATDLHLGRLQLRLLELADVAIGRGEDPLRALLGWPGDARLREAATELVAAWLRGAGIAAAVLFALAALWFIGFEASRWQATPGKRLAGLRVVADDGSRPGLARVAARFFGGLPSWLLLHLGHALAAWSRDRRALHDRLAGTRVVLVPDAGDAMPRWARAWLWAQGTALAALFTAALTYYGMLALEAFAVGLP